MTWILQLTTGLKEWFGSVDTKAQGLDGVNAAALMTGLF
jgi:hypothetical protein